MPIALVIVVILLAVAGAVMAMRLMRIGQRQSAELEAQLSSQIADQVRDVRRESGARSAEVGAEALRGLGDVRAQLAGVRGRLDQQSDRSSRQLTGQSDRIDRLLADVTSEFAEIHTAIQRLAAELRDEARSSRLLSEEHDSELRDQLTSLFQTDLGSQERRQQLAIWRVQQDIGDLTGKLSGVISNGQGQAQFRRSAEQRFAELAREADYLRRQLGSVLRFMHMQLDTGSDMSVAGAGQRHLAGGTFSGQPAAADVLPAFYSAFCRTLPVEVMLWERSDRAVTRFYLRWSESSESVPEELLVDLLGRCGNAVSDPAPSVNELRKLVLAIHESEPAAAQFGPVVVTRFAGRLIGGLVNDGGPSGRFAAEGTVHVALKPESILDLTSWASSLTS